MYLKEGEAFRLVRFIYIFGEGLTGNAHAKWTLFEGRSSSRVRISFRTRKKCLVKEKMRDIHQVIFFLRPNSEMVDRVVPLSRVVNLACSEIMSNG
ncbi:hypothetical protein K439DRAFT_800851 [Ramaria rubella]|nr:hypothetical protein K439DRAFT_800851 [Ramaria rubella]